MEKMHLIVDEEGWGRLDAYLAEALNEVSRSYVQKLIKQDLVKVNNRTVKAKYQVNEGDEIVVEIPEPKQLEVHPEDIPVDIIYEDQDLAVVYKPQGMVVHPAPGNYSGTLVNALLYHLQHLSSINGVIRPGIVHRIDKDTSGLLMIAKSNLAHISLSEQLKEHSTTRKYYTLVEGNIKEDKGTIHGAIARHPVDRKKMAVVPNGRKAVSHFEVIERFKEFTLLEVQLETGRTHQIRVHMAYIKHPVVGDPVYGVKKQKFSLKGQLLHAKVLGFVHPRTEQYMEFSSELPAYFERILEVLRRKKNSGQDQDVMI